MYDLRKNEYRIDIDILRGISIISVILFHFFPEIFPGGFFGVDIFFVISGYLITKIIYLSHKKNTFSIIHFYKRRALRIFPALSVFVIISLVIFTFLSSTYELKEISLQAFFGSIYLANYYFYSKNGYFQSESWENPYLHLWSLSIEEQFYIIYPIILIFIIKNFEKKAIEVLFIILMTSLTSMLLLKDKEAAFYITWFRAWELLAGGITFFISLKLKAMTLKKGYAAHVAYTLCFIVIIWVVIFIEKSKHPGWITIIIVFTSIIAITLGGMLRFSEKNILTNFLKNIGIISYSLYLWHFFSYSILFYIFTKVETKEKIFGIAISATLSYLSYILIEKPIRNNKDYSKAIYAWIFSTAFCALIIFFPNIAFIRDEIIVASAFARQDWEFPGDLKKDKNVPGYIYTNKPNIPPKVVIIGDSHSRHYAPRINYLTKNERNIKSIAFLNGITFIVKKCPYFNEIPRKNSPKYCKKRYSETKNFFRKYGKNIDSIIISAYWSGILIYNQKRYILCDKKYILATTKEGRKCFLNHLKEYINYLKEMAPKASIYILLDVPNHEKLDPKFYLLSKDLTEKWSRRIKYILKGKTTQIKEIDIKIKDIQKDLHHFIEKNASEYAKVINPLEKICKESRCTPYFYEKGKIYMKYKDDNHISASFSKKVDVIDKILIEGE